MGIPRFVVCMDSEAIASFETDEAAWSYVYVELSDMSDVTVMQTESDESQTMENI